MTPWLWFWAAAGIAALAAGWLAWPRPPRQRPRRMHGPLARLRALGLVEEALKRAEQDESSDGQEEGT